MRVLIAGLGNLLLRDDGVGVHAIRSMGNDLPPGVLAVEVGTAVLDALHLFEEAEMVIAIDAMKAGGVPGTIYSFQLSDVAAPEVPASLHEFSLLSALGLMEGPSRPEIAILGVEPEVIDYGMELSAAVQAALPRLVRAARDLAGRYLKETGVHCHA